MKYEFPWYAHHMHQYLGALGLLQVLCEDPRTKDSTLEWKKVEGACIFRPIFEIPVDATLLAEVMADHLQRWITSEALNFKATSTQSGYGKVVPRAPWRAWLRSYPMQQEGLAAVVSEAAVELRDPWKGPEGDKDIPLNEWLGRHPLILLGRTTTRYFETLSSLMKCLNAPYRGQGQPKAAPLKTARDRFLLWIQGTPVQDTLDKPKSMYLGDHVQISRGRFSAEIPDQNSILDWLAGFCGLLFVPITTRRTKVLSANYVEEARGFARWYYPLWESPLTCAQARLVLRIPKLENLQSQELRLRGLLAVLCTKKAPVSNGVWTFAPATVAQRA